MPTFIFQNFELVVFVASCFIFFIFSECRLRSEPPLSSRPPVNPYPSWSSRTSVFRSLSVSSICADPTNFSNPVSRANSVLSRRSVSVSASHSSFSGNEDNDSVEFRSTIDEEEQLDDVEEEVVEQEIEQFEVEEVVEQEIEHFEAIQVFTPRRSPRANKGKLPRKYDDFVMY